MTRPAVQLSTTHPLGESPPTVVRRVADCGFEGVEFCGRLRRDEVDAVEAALAETGTTPVAAHVDLRPLAHDPEAVLEPYAELGCRRLVVGAPHGMRFQTVGGIETLATRLETVGERVADLGLELCYHNGTAELRRPAAWTPLELALTQGTDEGAAGAVARLLDWVGAHLYDTQEPARAASTPAVLSETGFGRLVAATAPEMVSFEPNVASITTAGYDPVDVLRELQGRVPLVRIGDVEADVTGPEATQGSVAPGSGTVDFDRVARAARTNGAEWLVYEHPDPVEPAIALREGFSAIKRALDGVTMES